MRSARAPLAVLLCALALTGCGTFSALVDLSGRIEEAGYRQVSTDATSTNGETTLTVEASTPSPRNYDDMDIEAIAEIVWTTYPREFDVLLIVLNADVAAEITRDDLLDQFGPRPPNLVEQDRTRLIVVIVTLALFVLFITAIGVVLAMVLRRQSRRPPATAYWWPPQPPR